MRPNKKGVFNLPQSSQSQISLFTRCARRCSSYHVVWYINEVCFSLRFMPEPANPSPRDWWTHDGRTARATSTGTCFFFGPAACVRLALRLLVSCCCCSNGLCTPKSPEFTVDQRKCVYTQTEMTVLCVFFACRTRKLCVKFACACTFFVCDRVELAFLPCVCVCLLLTVLIRSNYYWLDYRWDYGIRFHSDTGCTNW